MGIGAGVPGVQGECVEMTLGKEKGGRVSIGLELAKDCHKVDAVILADSCQRKSCKLYQASWKESGLSRRTG